MRPVTFTVPGEPVPQPRTQFTVRGGLAKAYVRRTHRVHSYRKAIQLAAIDAGLRKTSSLVSVSIHATFKRKKSHLLKDGSRRKGAPLTPIPDVDNIAKAVLDAIGPIIGNDKQVFRVIAQKGYGVVSETKVTVECE